LAKHPNRKKERKEMVKRWNQLREEEGGKKRKVSMGCNMRVSNKAKGLKKWGNGRKRKRRQAPRQQREDNRGGRLSKMLVN